ncbi:MAG: addiction module toxin, HicA family [Candidatus Hydrogenedens sp.]|nr:addiction module toxin, HicA family [Candidatus Hydrogenedens sp.]
MQRSQFIKHLRSHDCTLIREGSRHSWWGNPARKRRSAVPRHREVDDTLCRKICRDLDIPTP